MVDYIPDINFSPQGAVEPGVYIMPGYVKGASPLNVVFEIHATPGYGDQVVTEYAMSMGDGTIIKGNFQNLASDGIQIAVVPYTYKYTKGSSKYTGRTLYPDATVKTNKGYIKSVNHNRQKATEVWVWDPKFDPSGSPL